MQNSLFCSFKREYSFSLSFNHLSICIYTYICIHTHTYTYTRNKTQLAYIPPAHPPPLRAHVNWNKHSVPRSRTSPVVGVLLVVVVVVTRQTELIWPPSAEQYLIFSLPLSPGSVNNYDRRLRSLGTSVESRPRRRSE